MFIARPSGETTLLDGTIPDNLVPRNGGHLHVNRDLDMLLGVSDNRLGFTIISQADGTLGVTWRSEGINMRNPNIMSLFI